MTFKDLRKFLDNKKAKTTQNDQESNQQQNFLLKKVKEMFAEEQHKEENRTSADICSKNVLDYNAPVIGSDKNSLVI
jgi:hypothetical protein